MSAPYTVRECTQCGYVAHPPRILCPVCASSSWKPRLAAQGIVTELTVRRPVSKRRQLPSGNWLEQKETRLACVMTDAGVRVIARIPEGVVVGDRVSLTSMASTAIALPGQVAQATADSSAQMPHPPMSDYPGRT
jgi:uncharacterized OB-fold protein